MDFRSNPFLSNSSGPTSRGSAVRWDAKTGTFAAFENGLGMGEIAPGSGIVIDTGAYEVGAVAFNSDTFGKYKEFMFPRGEAMNIPDHPDLKAATKLPVVVEGLDDNKRVWLVTGQILLNATSDAVRLASFKREACEGQIPMYRYTGSKTISTNYGDFFAPILQLVGFVERDEAFWGPRTVAPPTAMLSAAEAARKIEQAALAPAPQPVVSPVAAAEPEPPPPSPAPKPAIAAKKTVPWNGPTKARAAPAPTPAQPWATEEDEDEGPAPPPASVQAAPKGNKPFAKKPF